MIEAFRICILIHPAADDSFTVRSVFIIDHRRSVRLVITYPASTEFEFFGDLAGCGFFAINR